MKKIILFVLFPLLCIGQTQIGANIYDGSFPDVSGTSVSLSADGSILAIGAPFNNVNGSISGSVRVFQNVSGNWIQVGTDINGEAADNVSGKSVSLSSDGSILAIGAPGGNTNIKGSVRVYKNISGNWTKVGADIEGEELRDWSGNSVSLSGDGSIVAIGALRNDGNGTDSGSVRVYKNVSNTWIQVGADMDGEAVGDQSGTGLSLSADGSILAIGAGNNSGNGIGSGSVRVYKNVLGTWTQVGTDINGEAAGDISGYSVSLSSDGAILAIGALKNDGNGTDSGSVRVYQNVSGTWIQVGADIDGEAAGDDSGFSVSLSGDGTILAIGARGNDENGTDSGLVRVYKNISGSWIQIGTDINGEASDDRSGYSVSLSADGKTVAIGAPDYLSNDSGYVRVYDLSAVLSSDSFVLANFSVYPNPVSEVVTISLQEGLTLEKVNVYNTLGQLVKTENKDVIAVNSLAKGSYFFEVITNKGKATKQIVVQ